MTLRPLTMDDVPSLYVAAKDQSFWHLLPAPSPQSEGDVETWVSSALDAQRRGHELPFAIFANQEQTVVGSTRFLDFQPQNRSVEIGWTWIAGQHQRTPINTECKFLLLTHAFEAMSIQRVQLKTDLRNHRSQTAIARIGATREGVLRKHRINWDGYVRDTVYFSILDTEWPGVKRHLALLMG